MGSDLRVTAWTADEARGRRAIDRVFDEFDRLDRLMSVWREGSDVLRINAAAGISPVKVADDVRSVLHTSIQVSEWTGGKFDVTFGALSDLWRFDQDQDNVVPSPEAVRARLPLIDYRAIDIDDAHGTVMLKRKGMRIHLGGIGKGYALERSVAILRESGLKDFLIKAGGDMYVGGLHGGRPWRLGIADPRGAHEPFAQVELTDATFSTSGDYERFFFKDGRRYHHIIDPSTGEPAGGCRSVTIVADSPLLADGLSTGVFLLGPRAGLELIERLPRVAGVIVSSSNEVLVSSRLRGRISERAPPTDAP